MNAVVEIVLQRGASIVMIVEFSTAADAIGADATESVASIDVTPVMTSTLLPRVIASPSP